MNGKSAPKGPMGGGRTMTTEKAKDFKGTFKRLIKSLGKYKIGILLLCEEFFEYSNRFLSRTFAECHIFNAIFFITHTI